jgi:hypothetical protein
MRLSDISNVPATYCRRNDPQTARICRRPGSPNVWRHHGVRWRARSHRPLVRAMVGSGPSRVTRRRYRWPASQFGIPIHQNGARCWQLCRRIDSCSCKMPVSLPTCMQIPSSAIVFTWEAAVLTSNIAGRASYAPLRFSECIRKSNL